MEMDENELIAALILAFLLFACAYILVVWKRQNRHYKRYVDLQQKMMQVRMDMMSLNEEKEQGGDVEDSLREWRLLEKQKEQFQLCLSVFKDTGEYERLLIMGKATMLQMKTLEKDVIPNVVLSIRKFFADVMLSLKSCSPALTNDDAFYCVLSLLHCEGIVILELMNASPGAVKSRKNRIKNKISSFLFEYLFGADNQ